jgi:hypothetical protein
LEIEAGSSSEMFLSIYQTTGSHINSPTMKMETASPFESLEPIYHSAGCHTRSFTFKMDGSIYQNTSIFLTSYVCMFRMTFTINSNYSLYSINRLVFVTVTQFVVCEV